MNFIIASGLEEHAIQRAYGEATGFSLLIPIAKSLNHRATFGAEREPFACAERLKGAPDHSMVDPYQPFDPCR